MAVSAYMRSDTTNHHCANPVAAYRWLQRIKSRFGGEAAGSAISPSRFDARHPHEGPLVAISRESHGLFILERRFQIIDQAGHAFLRVVKLKLPLAALANHVGFFAA